MTIGCELYKVLLKRKIIFFIMTALIVKLVLLFFSQSSAFILKVENSQTYKQYMSILSGELTSEKKAFVLEKKAEITNAQSDSVETLGEYANGKISYAQFNEQMNQNNAVINNKSDIDAVYAQYLNVQANPDKVFFMMQNGWNSLLGKSNLDFILIFLVIIVTVPIFCGDSSNEMNDILKCCEKGRLNLSISKILSGIILSTTCAILFISEEIIFYAIKYGLHNGNYPIQSISQFQSSGYEMTLYGLLIATVTNILAGCAFLAVITMFISVITEKSLTAAFIPAIISFLPYFIFSGVGRYHLPIPLGFFMSTGYLQGLVRNADFIPEENVISKAEYIRNIIISASISFCMIVLSVRYFLSKSLFWHKKKRVEINYDM